MWLLIAFIGVPLLEITLFIQVGGAIGLKWTLLIVIITAILGTVLVRSQGRSVMAKLQSSFSELNDPTEPLAHGAMILFAGALLLTPGFFTDALGFALMVPQFRTWMFNYLRKRVKVQSFTMGGGMGGQRRPPHDPNVIDGEFEEVREPHDSPTLPSGPSGWTKH
jgi:UPF0716 protein FxsA